MRHSGSDFVVQENLSGGFTGLGAGETGGADVGCRFRTDLSLLGFVVC